MTSARARAAAAGLVVTALLAACADPDSAALAGLGAACDAALRCEAEFVCVDGRCLERPDVLPVAPDTTPVAPAWIDVVAPADTALEAADGAPEDGTGDAADEVEVAPPALVEQVLAPHDALASPSDTRLGLASGQAAVRQTVAPTGARATAIEAVLRPPGGEGGCGLYEVLLWFPDAAGFAVEPSWRGLTGPTPASTDVVRVALPEPLPELPAGPIRFGLRYEAPCEGYVYAPWLELDASGDASDSFVWVSVWIPGTALSLSGHWGLSLVVLAPAPRFR